MAHNGIRLRYRVIGHHAPSNVEEMEWLVYVIVGDVGCGLTTVKGSLMDIEEERVWLEDSPEPPSIDWAPSALR
ncbi:MAG: hypothetical protein DLM70_12000 [Chloroflexi bacterium]|nr:MAG: hypothetical protein DLM70_12000 [Chloroflexota bacterium]